MEFEWDEQKRVSNLGKHGIDFEDAIGIFQGPVLENRSDRGSEQRWLAVGEIEGELIAVAYTYRADRIRIISARRARDNERREYRQTYPTG